MKPWYYIKSRKRIWSIRLKGVRVWSAWYTDTMASTLEKASEAMRSMFRPDDDDYQVGVFYRGKRVL